MPTTPDGLAEKITSKAVDTLASLQFEMTMMRWPPEFRAIMWDAVGRVAMARAAEASIEAAPPAAHGAESSKPMS